MQTPQVFIIIEYKIGVYSKFFEDLGISCLKDNQTEAILSFINGNDTFVSLPTGYGKSIIYGLLPFLFGKMKGKFWE